METEAVSDEELADLCREVEAHCSNTAIETYNRLTRALQASRERERLWRKCVEDMTDDMECLPGCNSDWHEELCPVTNAAAAWRNLRQRVEAAERRVTEFIGTALSAEVSTPVRSPLEGMWLWLTSRRQAR